PADGPVRGDGRRGRRAGRPGAGACRRRQALREGMNAAPRDCYAAARQSAEVLAAATGQPGHDAAVVLGSGWAPAADALAGALSAEVTEVPLARLGGFPPSTVTGHQGMARSLVAGGLRLLVFLGRVHLYEGHPPGTVVHGVRTAVAAGCRT